MEKKRVRIMQVKGNKKFNKKRISVLAIGAVAAVASVSAQISEDIRNSEGLGYLERGRLMMQSGNYVGATDQLNQLLQSSIELNIAQKEECEYLLARAAYERGEAKCVALLKRFLSEYPASVYSLNAELTLGDWYFFNKEFGNAALVYREVNRDKLESSQNGTYTYRLALSELKNGEFDNAQTLFTSLRGDKQYNAAAVFYLAYIDYAEGKYEKALSGFKEAQTLTSNYGSYAANRDYQPTGLEADYYITQIYFKQGKYKEVISEGTNLLSKKPIADFVPETQRIIGESYFKLGDESSAKKYLTNYLRTPGITPTSTALYAMGVIEYSEGDYKSAAQNFEQISDEVNELGQSAYLYLGQCAVKNGDLSAATIDFEKAWRMGFDKNVTETALYNYVAARMDGGDVPFSSSVDILETFLNSYPNSKYASSVREYLAASYFEEKDYTKALASINKIKNPSSKVLDAKQKVLYELGVEAVSNGKNTEAINYLNQAISMSSRNAEIANQSRLWLGEAYYAEGNFKNATSTLETYIKSDKNSSNRGLALYNLAYSLYMQDKFQESGTYFSQARKSSSLSQNLKNDALLREADCLYYRKDYSGALSLYKQAETSEGSDVAYAAMRSAVMEGLKGDKDKKIASLQSMIKNYPDSKWVPTASMELASTYEALGKTTEAQKVYKNVFDGYPTTAEARQAALKLGVSYATNGNTESGINTLKQVIEKWPTSDEAQTANTELKRLMGAENRLSEYVSFLSAIPGAPKIDTNEVEQLTFEAAETAWAEDSSSVKLLEEYVSAYPDGTYLARALSDLAISYEEKGQYEKALSTIDKLVSSRSDAAQVPEALLLKATIIEEKYPARKSEALAAYRSIVNKNYADKMPEVYVGIMRLSDSPTEVVSVSEKIADGKGLSATQLEEANYYKAVALEKLNRGSEAEALYKQLATNVKSLYGAKGAVALGEYYISTKQYDKALSSMKQFTDEGTPHSYWLARGYITLADAYYAKGKKSTAREYIISLRENYPGAESDIKEMITERINTWK